GPARCEDDRAEQPAAQTSGAHREPRCNPAGRTDMVAPRTRFQARVSPHRRVAFGSLSLAEVKTIKNTFGCTVNDVVLAICTAGLRTWLDERGELPTEPLAGFIP